MFDDALFQSGRDRLPGCGLKHLRRNAGPQNTPNLPLAFAVIIGPSIVRAVLSPAIKDQAAAARLDRLASRVHSQTVHPRLVLRQRTPLREIMLPQRSHVANSRPADYTSRT